MFKLEKCIPNTFKRGFRVECNNGSKHFSDMDEAVAYYEYMQARKLDAELWLMTLYYDDEGALERGEQKLLYAQDAQTFVDFT